MQNVVRKTLLGVIVAIGLALLSWSAMAQNVLPSFTDVPVTGSPYINPSITASPTSTGIAVGAGTCLAGSFVNLGLDGVVVQSIRVDNSLPGGANLQITHVGIQNLGSAPASDLDSTRPIVVYGVTDSGATYCIASGTLLILGITTAPFAYDSSTITPAVTVPAGVSYINVAVQPAIASGSSMLANVNGDTINLRTQIDFTTVLGGVFFQQNSAAVVVASSTFQMSVGGLEKVETVGVTPDPIAPVNTNPVIDQIVDVTHWSQNSGVETDVVDICVKNQGSALADEDIQKIEVFDAFGHLIVAQPGTSLAKETKCDGANSASGLFNGSPSSQGFGVSLNPGVSKGTTSGWINYLIPNSDTPTRFKIRVTLRNTAISGRMVKLQTTFVTALATTSGSSIVGTITNFVNINSGSLPSAVMPDAVTISNGSAIVKVGDVKLIQALTGRNNIAQALNVPIIVSNFPFPGFGGLSATLSYDPSVIRVLGGCFGVSGNTVQTASNGFPYQFTTSCLNVNGSEGKANFSVILTPPGSQAPTYGSSTVAYIVVVAQPGSHVDESTVMSLNLLSVTDANGNPVVASTTPGTVTIQPLGDVNENGKVEVNDAILLANAITTTCLVNSTIIQSQTGSFKLTVPQLEKADVAPPFAVTIGTDVTVNPLIFNCSNITSADVAGIGRLALSNATIGQGISSPEPKSQRVDFFTSLLRWLGLIPAETPTPRAVVDLKAGSVADSLELTVSHLTNTALGGLQGTLTYDPKTMQVKQIVSENGYTVLAQAIDNTNGTVRFNAISMSGEPVQEGAVVRFELAQGSLTDSARLGLDQLAAADGSTLAFRINQTQAADVNSNEVTALQVKALSVQALSDGPGAQISVEGSGITGLALAVYDLSGQLVASEQAEGHNLAFRALSTHGQPLANGVYLYTVTVRGASGQTFQTQVRKLVVLR